MSLPIRERMLAKAPQPMIETSQSRTMPDARYAVHLVHSQPEKRRRWTLCDRRVGLGDNDVIPYDVVAEAQAATVDCPQCLGLAEQRARRWRAPRKRREVSSQPRLPEPPDDDLRAPPDS